MIDFFISTYLGAFLLILIGLLLFIHTIKYSVKDSNSPLQPYMSGIAGGLMLIIAGIIVFVIRIMGNW